MMTFSLCEDHMSLIRFLNMTAIVAASVTYSCLGSTGALAAIDPSFGYLALGDLRGHFEPCGCDPATDLGGVRRIFEMVARERLQDQDLVTYCLGNLLAPSGEDASKSPFILEAIASSGIAACLLNQTELQHPKELRAFFGSGSSAHAALPFLSSNLKNATAWRDIVQESIEGKAYVALGYTDPAISAGAAQPVTPQLLVAWAKLLAKAAKKEHVLLFSGSDEDLKKVEASGLFDVVISSNRAPLSTIIGTSERDDERKLERPSKMGVMMTPLGVQGALRGGKARFAEAKSVSQLLAPAEGGSGAALTLKSGTLPTLAAAKAVTWLDRSYENEATLSDLFKRYNDFAKARFASAAEARLKDLATTPFVGAEACIACHKPAYDVWKSSQHARAFPTLEEKKKSEDPDCVSCHVLGPKDKGGFVSAKASPQFENVQCEICHGPRRDHAANPTKKPVLAMAAMDVCSTCHNSQHSPAFKHDEYWKKISHGK